MAVFKLVSIWRRRSVAEAPEEYLHDRAIDTSKTTGQDARYGCVNIRSVGPVSDLGRCGSYTFHTARCPLRW